MDDVFPIVDWQMRETLSVLRSCGIAAQVSDVDAWMPVFASYRGETQRPTQHSLFFVWRRRRARACVLKKSEREPPPRALERKRVCVNLLRGGERGEPSRAGLDGPALSRIWSAQSWAAWVADRLADLTKTGLTSNAIESDTPLWIFELGRLRKQLKSAARVRYEREPRPRSREREREREKRERESEREREREREMAPSRHRDDKREREREKAPVGEARELALAPAGAAASASFHGDQGSETSPRPASREAPSSRTGSRAPVTSSRPASREARDAADRPPKAPNSREDRPESRFPPIAR